MITATIFNIQKFCTHDGPGIRTTVFLKGCPLRCRWCHNPESQHFGPELLFDSEQCSGCGQCAVKCDRGAIAKKEGKIIHNHNHCIGCGGCIDSCFNNAREIAGREYGIVEVLTEIEKDRPFYEQSRSGNGDTGGGVTFSGGEAMSQIDFLVEITQACKRRDIHVAVDTCGHVPWSSYERVLPYSDLFLFDLKLMDPARHRQYTGQDNRWILENLSRLSAAGARINLRIPLLEGINTSNDDLAAVIRYISGLTIREINLLPYHDIGRNKYARLGREYQKYASPSPARLEEIKFMFSEQGYQIKIGG